MNQYKYAVWIFKMWYDCITKTEKIIIIKFIFLEISKYRGFFPFYAHKYFGWFTYMHVHVHRWEKYYAIHSCYTYFLYAVCSIISFTCAHTILYLIFTLNLNLSYLWHALEDWNCWHTGFYFLVRGSFICVFIHSFHGIC